MDPSSVRDLQASAAGHIRHGDVTAEAAEGDELIRVCRVATQAASRHMTPHYLKALDDSIEQACSLPSRYDWDRKATAHAEIVNLLADAAGDPALAVLTRNVPGQLHELMIAVGPVTSGIIAGSRRRLLALLRAGDADGAAREIEQHIKGLFWIRRLSYDPARDTGDIAV
jgi:DNA-binding GntR family transcriptional regulator